MAKGIWLRLSDYDNIGYSYVVDEFNQCLKVKLTAQVSANLHDSFLKEAVNEAYEHYNLNHPNNQFIHPSAIVKPTDE